MIAVATDSMRERFTSVATELLDTDPRLALVLADIGAAGFARALRRHPERVINVGIREQLMIGVAAGLALAGFRPIAHSYTPFLVQRPAEQLKLDLGHQDLGAILVSIGASHDAAAEGRTHQAPEDVAMLGDLPGWEVVVPGHPDEAESALRAAAAGSGRVYLRLAEQVNARPVTDAHRGLSVIRRGADATVIAVGPMLDRVLEAAESLDVTVLYATTVRPFDAATLRWELGTPDVVLVEPYLEGTTAALVAESLRTVRHRLLSIGVPRGEQRRYGTAEEHDAAHELDAPGLRRRIKMFLDEAA